MCLSGGKEKEIASISSAKSKDSSMELAQEIEHLIQKEQDLKLKSLEGIVKSEPQNFEQISKQLPKQIQQTLQKLDASQVYRTFKLVGKDYVVHDRRDEKEAPKPKDHIADEAKKPLSELLLREGKLTPTKEKTYENYLAGFDKVLHPAEQGSSLKRYQPLFTHFEEVLIRRFEEGKAVAQNVEEGVALFLKKTVTQWRSFFARFRGRTVSRQVEWENVQEMVFRDLVLREGRQMLISDFSLTNGLLEKFARLRLDKEWQQLAEWLTTLNPGQVLSQEMIKKYGKGRFQYLAIKEPKEEEVRTWSRPAAGKFLMAAQTEEKIAKDLGVSFGSPVKVKGKPFGTASGKGKGGLEEEEVFEEPKAFVPWWSLPRLRKYHGKVRWFVVATYLALSGFLIFALIALFQWLS